MPQRLDFAQWEFANVQLAPLKLKLATGNTTTTIIAGLAAETAARIAGDSSNSASIAAEIAARIAGDAANAAAIVAEAGTRAAADTALQNQITALQQPVFERNMLLGGM